MDAGIPRLSERACAPQEAFVSSTANEQACPSEPPFGCDGDTISMTAATNPSLEDILLGAIPGTPRVSFYNPVLAADAGELFMRPYRRAAEGKGGPFILVVEGSIPDETNKTAGTWTGFGVDHATGQPIPITDWLDRLAPRAWAVLCAGTCSAYGGVHGMPGNPTGCMGLSDRLGPNFRCLVGGRHVHPSTLYPGGVGTVPSHQLFTEYLSRLMRYVDHVKRMLSLHDDLFDFFYEALPTSGGGACSWVAGGASRTRMSATTGTRP